VSVHVPSLPSSVAWETPINVSRDVLGAISDAADSAAETAGHLIRPRRSSPVRSAATSKWTAVAVTVLVALMVATIVRRSRSEDHTVDDARHAQRDAGASGTGGSTD
jgi:hypothetical protein